jgi:hypothetical protein
MVNEIIVLLLPLIGLILRHLISARIDRKSELENAMKEQRVIDEAASTITLQNKERSRRERGSVAPLQDAMDEDVP